MYVNKIMRVQWGNSGEESKLTRAARLNNREDKGRISPDLFVHVHVVRGDKEGVNLSCLTFTLKSCSV